MRPLLAALLAAGLSLASWSGEDPRALIREGAALLEKRLPQEAEPLLRRAAAMAPEDALAHAWIGKLLLAQEKPSEAQEAFERALKLDETRPALVRSQRREVLDLVGLALAFQRKFAEAKEAYGRAIAYDATYSSFRYNLACVCALGGDRPGALKALAEYYEVAKARGAGEPAIDAALDPDFKGLVGDPAFEGLMRERLGSQPDDTAASALVRTAGGLLGRGQNPDALKLLEKAVAAAPEDCRAWFFFAGALDAMGEKARAGEAYGKALGLSVPPRARLTKEMRHKAALEAGRARLAAGNPAEAVPLLEQARDAEGMHPAAYFELARAFAAKGDGVAALDSLLKALGLREELPPVEGPFPEPMNEPLFKPFKEAKGWEVVFPPPAPEPTPAP